MPKDEISLIEISKPGLLKGGHLVIVSKSGRHISIMIGHKQAFEHLNLLMLGFYRQALSIS